ncbi:MAG: RidA family protein [Rhizobiales bacterium]|jgi:enamine deaminase RidA (YjgF/YER057c/UK114 family)|nr:RidA family protein [Hyphomicrobiales bacterium]
MLDKSKSQPTVLRPKGWPQPKGYSDGMSAKGRVIVTGGVVGWDEQGKFGEGLAAQTGKTLENIVAIIAEAGAGPEHIVRLTWYVTDIENYLALQREIGAAYRDVMGKHFPAMAVVQVVRLVEKAALVEIEATAVLPE